MKALLIISLIAIAFCGQYDEQVWNYFKDKGLSDTAVAALMGNLYAESKIDSQNIWKSLSKTNRNVTTRTLPKNW